MEKLGALLSNKTLRQVIISLSISFRFRIHLTVMQGDLKAEIMNFVQGDTQYKSSEGNLLFYLMKARRRPVLFKDTMLRHIGLLYDFVLSGRYLTRLIDLASGRCFLIL